MQVPIGLKKKMYIIIIKVVIINITLTTKSLYTKKRYLNYNV